VIDVELSANDPETKRLLEVLGPDANELPIVLFPDGSKLLESVPPMSHKKSVCELARKPVSTTWLSSVEAPPVLLRLSTERQKVCTP
jgi:hypothetical protein